MRTRKDSIVYATESECEMRRSGQPSKQDRQIVSIDAGRQTDRSDEHTANANSPTVNSREPDSNLNVERPSHRLKQRVQIISTDEGIQIVRSDEQAANAELPSDETCQTDSNVTSESCSH
jgi:hypothetical protein